jgi:hypothetical protein
MGDRDHAKPSPGARHRRRFLRHTHAACGAARAQAPAVDADDIGGVVTSSKGPEAGVWVIAETNAFQTRFARIVVTDDAGRFVIPDLPAADYQVWVRGYGLSDSDKTAAKPGATVNLTAKIAATPADAAKVYPAIYWYSMQKLPSASEVSKLPGGVDQYVASIKNLSCIGCHQIGQLATRTIPPAFGHGQEGWVRRIQSGQAGSQMLASAQNQLGGVPPKYLGDWTDRVAAGELPHSQPPRPQASSATSLRRSTTGRRRARTCTTERHRQAQADRERLRQALRSARAQHRRLPDPRSENNDRDLAACDGARREHADDEEHARRRSRRTTGAASRSGTAKRTRTTRCSMRRAAFGTPPSWRAGDAAGVLQGGLEQSVREAFPLNQSGRQLAVYDPKPRNTPTSTRATRRTICSSPKTRTTPFGRAAEGPSSAG